MRGEAGGVTTAGQGRIITAQSGGPGATARQTLPATGLDAAAKAAAAGAALVVGEVLLLAGYRRRQR